MKKVLDSNSECCLLKEGFCGEKMINFVNKTNNFILKMYNFVQKMNNFVQTINDFVLKMKDFVNSSTGDGLFL